MDFPQITIHKPLAIIMKKQYLGILVILVFFSCIPKNKAQSENGTTDCNDLVEISGKWLLNNKPYTGNCENYENGILRSYAEFQNGLVHGEMKYYFANGKVEEIVEWEKGKANGKVKYFYQNGQLSEEGQVTDNSKEGTWKSYHANGKLKNHENWKNNQMQDSVFSYFANGNLHSKGIFINGKEDGRWIMYDSISGKIDGYLIYKNGEPIKAEKK